VEAVRESCYAYADVYYSVCCDAVIAPYIAHQEGLFS
jgi:hypothetical protein